MFRRFLPLLFSASSLCFVAGCAGEDAASDYADRMAEEHEHDMPTGNVVAWMEPAQPVSERQVWYATVGTDSVSGYLVTPENATQGGLPGIIVIHEWWGLNDNVRAMARRLAGEGYTALAVDLYGGRVAQEPDSAMAFMRRVSANRDVASDNLMQAYQYLETQQNAPRIGVIGWCFGGGWALRTALMLPEQLDAAVIYYGQVVTNPEELAALNVPLLGIFGEDDEGIPIAQVRSFETVLDTLGKQADIQIYENAAHAFANPSGQRYNETAAQDAWQRTQAFLDRYLKQPVPAEAAENR